MNKAVFTKMNIKGQNRLMGFVFDERGKSIRIRCLDDVDIIGNIYVGRVERVVSELSAAFVVFEDGRSAYMDLPSVTDDVIFTQKNSKNDGICSNDELLIQITADSKGSKNPICTCNISFSSEHLVITPVNKTLGVSKKLDGKYRDTLKSWLDSKKDLNIGIVARTAAKNVSTHELDAELSQLINMMKLVVENSKSRKAPSLEYKRENSFEDFLKGIDKADTEFVTDVADVVKKLDSFWIKPRYYTDTYPLVKLYSLERELDNAVKKVINLPSGGNIVIDRTEAMTVFDVNSSGAGKRAGALDTNTEAAEEIMRQLVIRNISGIIIVDFINMTDDEGGIILSMLQEKAKADPLKTRVMGYTRLGLCEITRKKEKKSLFEQIND